MPESFFNEVVGRKPKACNFIKKDTPAQLKVVFFLWTNASRYIKILTVIKFQH